MNSDLRAQFSAELNQIPMLQKQLAEIAEIPVKLDNLIERMERSNINLASHVSGTMTRTAKELTAVSSHGVSSPYASPKSMSGWMKWTIVVSVILIAVACISNTVYNIWFASNFSTSASATKWVETEEADSTIVIKTQGDSMQVRPTPKGLQQVPSSQNNEHQP